MEYSKTKFPFVSGRKYNNLLKEYDEVVGKLENLLCCVTGNKLSKATYSSVVMETEATHYMEELCNKAVKEVLEKNDN